MAFRIVSERKFSKEELEIFREARALLGEGVDRRELMKLMVAAGLSGPLLALSTRPAHAFVPAIFAGAILIASTIFSGAAVAASFPLANKEDKPVRGGVAMQLKDPGGSISQQDSAYVQIPPESEIQVEHSDFEARVLGENEYIAKTSLDRETASFDVEKE